MKKRLLFIWVVVVLLIGSLTVSASAEQQEDIIILYENDAHCEIEGYSVLSAMRNELKQEYRHVGIVTSGDFLQGGSLGSISKGEYIVRLMNLIGYDAIALGNHEFDYGLDRLFELSDMLDTKPVCANFKKIGEGECFAPYSIVSYGTVKIAYIGITTPETPEKTSFPTQFFDENKNPIYTFSKDDMAAVVQENIDQARAEGADFVIALSHIGDKTMVLVSTVKAGLPPEMAYANVGIVVENMVIAATSLGIDSVILGGAPAIVSQNEAMVKELGIPEGFTPVLGALFGYAQCDEPAKEHAINVNRV